MVSSSKKILVVGSWAKEQITVKMLKKDPSLRVFAYMDTRNPGITALAHGYKIGNLTDTEDILSYCRKINPGLVIITTASPLKMGVTDLLEKKGIPVFGPEKEAARLENDKAFTRNLMKKYKINGLPRFAVFRELKGAEEFARSLNWKVAVKPVGLTQGLGVKVEGEQLKGPSQVLNYIEEILGKEEGAEVLIEEKLRGEEFTIQCLVNEDTLLPTPAVQDFKKLLPQDRGPNTASMGSYSGKGVLLPFMKKEDCRTALKIISETISAFKKETGKNCRGFLYGQFMSTKKGLKLIEYNFRPGDPEWLNTCAILKDNLFKLITELLRNKKPKINFKNKATVCKYLVPPAYPHKLNQTIDAQINEKTAAEKGVGIFYSCGYDKNNKLNTGSERGIALLATGESICGANKKIERTIETVKGSFRYRKDIGTKEILNLKKAFLSTRA